MASMFVAVVCLLMGVFLRKLGRLPAGADRTVAGVVIQLSAPPVSFLAARTMPISPEMLLPASMAWIVFAAGFAFFGALRKPLGMTRETFGCLMLTAGLSNIVFIGLPMIEAFFGHEFTYIAFLCDSPGVTLVLALPGVLLASYLSPLEKRPGGTARQVARALKSVALFPPFEGLVLGLLLRPVALPVWLIDGLRGIGATLVPLSLFSVGLGLSLKLPRGARAPLAAGLAYKLMIAPLIMLALVLFVYRNTGPVAQVTVFEAAMPPMVLGGILATDNGLDPELASLLVSVGTPLAFLTLALWRWIIAATM